MPDSRAFRWRVIGPVLGWQTASAIARASRILKHHFSRAAARATACSPATGHLRRQGRKSSLPPVAHWKLPPERVVEDDAGVYADSVNFISAIGDHEE
jgi:hypothetical protein